MELDIRDNKESVVESIRVWDGCLNWYAVDVVERDSNSGGVRLIDSETDGDRYVEVIEKEHAQNLIKGLQKAIDLGWFD